MIKAYAYIEDWGRVVRLLVGNVLPAKGGELFCGFDFATGRTQEPQEVGPMGQPTGGYNIPLEYAEEIYHSLDRIFGKRDETPGIVKDVLAKEQQRVDTFINWLVEQ